MAKNKEKAPNKSGLVQNSKGASKEEKKRVPEVDLPKREPKKEQNPKKDAQQKRQQQYKKVKDAVKQRNAQVKDLNDELDGLKKQINKKDELTHNAFAQAELCRRTARNNDLTPEEKRQWIDQASVNYDLAKKFEAENRAAKEEAETIKSRLDAAKYANLQSRRSFYEAMNSINRGALGILKAIWEKTPFYLVYKFVTTAILDRQTGQSQKSMLDQYDEIRKDQRLEQEITRATKDVSHEVEQCLNNEEKSEIEKIEDLSLICAKSRATIVAQLNDKEALQFKFIPSFDSRKKGVIEISKRDLMHDINGKAALGEEKLVSSINYDGTRMGDKFLNLSEERKNGIKLGVYGMLHPDGHNALLQVMDPDIAKAVREELDRNVAHAQEWDPKKERHDSEIATKALTLKKKEEELAKMREEAEKAARAEKAAQPKKYEHLPDFIYGRVDLKAMSPKEAETLRKDLIKQIKTPSKDFKPSKEQMALEPKAIVSKLRTQSIVLVDNKLYDEKSGKEILVTMKVDEKEERIPLDFKTIKSDTFISKSYESVIEQKEKNQAQLNSLLSGEKLSDKDGYDKIAKTLRAEIMRAGDSRDAASKENPIIVDSKHELVQKILNGEVVFANDIGVASKEEQSEEKEPEQKEASEQSAKTDNEKDAQKDDGQKTPDSKDQDAAKDQKESEPAKDQQKKEEPAKAVNKEKQNRILVDKETGAQLVYTAENGTMRTWTEHDFSEKDFARSVQKEAEELKMAQEKAADAEKAEEAKSEEPEKESAEQEKEASEPAETPEPAKDNEPAAAKDELEKAAESKEGVLQTPEDYIQSEPGVCQTLEDVSVEEVPDKEVQEIKEHLDTINRDGYLLNAAGEKICNKDGDAYCISDFKNNPEMSEFLNEKYAEAYNMAFSIDEVIVDPAQMELMQDEEEEYEVSEQYANDHNVDYVHDDIDMQNCDTVMAATSIHAHGAEPPENLYVDNNYNGIDDRYEEH